MEINRATWKIFYADSSSFTNEDGPPEQAPKCGVLAIVFYNLDNRREIIASKDFLWYDETPIYQDESGGTFYGGDWAGFFQYITRPGKKIVFLGATVHDFIWRKRLEKIINEFPDALGVNVKLPKIRDDIK